MRSSGGVGDAASPIGECPIFIHRTHYYALSYVYVDKGIGNKQRIESKNAPRGKQNHVLNVMHNHNSRNPLYVYIHGRTTALNFTLLLLLGLSLNLLLQLTLRLALQLVGTTNSDVLRTEITEQMLENILNQPAATVVEDHQNGQGNLELIGERHKAQLLVQLGDELGGAGECDTGGGDETPVHGLVLADGLAEGTALVIDREGGDLLDQLEEVDGAVQERRLKLAFEIDIAIPSMCGLVSVLDMGELGQRTARAYRHS